MAEAAKAGLPWCSGHNHGERELARKRLVVARDVGGDADRLGPEDRAVVGTALDGRSSLTGEELEALSRGGTPWASASDHGCTASSSMSPVVSTATAWLAPARAYGVGPRRQSAEPGRRTMCRPSPMHRACTCAKGSLRG